MFQYPTAIDDIEGSLWQDYKLKVRTDPHIKIMILGLAQVQGDRIDIDPCERIVQIGQIDRPFLTTAGFENR